MMKERRRMKWAREYRYEIIVVFIILIQVIYISCMFGINKQGFHSDELWNYGFANSTEGTHIYQSDLGHIPKNLDSWQSSENFRKYITVDKNEIFNYGAVYWNAACDYNPPLGYMMLHFVCSLFAGTWSKWYCFILNIICFMIMQIYLYRLGYLITQNKLAGIFTVLFFGFTVGALNISVFLRIYAPATMFGVMFLYYSNLLFTLKDNKDKHYNIYIKIFCITLAGSLTLHFFLPFAFIIIAMYSIYYLMTKNYKQFWVYGLVITIGVLLSIFIFPNTIGNMFGGNETLTYTNKKYSAIWQNKIYWAYMTNDLFGIHNSIWKTMTSTYILYGIGIILFLTLPLCFVFRNEKWLKKIISELKNKVKDIFDNISKCPYTLVVMIVTIIFIIYVAASRTSIGGMGRYCTRYIFIIYPVMALFAVITVWYIVGYIIKNYKLKLIVCVLMCLTFIILSNVLASKDYYFRHFEEGTTLTKIEDNANCIIVTSQAWLITCYTCELFNTQNYYVADYESSLTDCYESDKINANDPLYLILDISNMDGNGRIIGDNIMDQRDCKEYSSEEYLKYFEELDISSKVEYVGTDAVFGRAVKIYRLN